MMHDGDGARRMMNDKWRMLNDGEWKNDGNDECWMMNYAWWLITVMDDDDDDDDEQ